MANYRKHYPKNTRQPARDYLGERKKGRIGGALWNIGRIGSAAAGSVFKEITKPGPKTSKTPQGRLVSDYFSKKRMVDIEEAKRWIDASLLPRHKKIHAKLRLEGQIADPRLTHDPHLTTQKREMLEKEIKGTYGEKQREKVSKVLDELFRGKGRISGEEARRRIDPIMRDFRPEERTGINLILNKYTQKPQLGVRGRHVTNEKLESLIKQTREESGGFDAQALRRALKMREEAEEQESDSQQSQRVPQSRKVSIYNNWGRRSGDTSNAEGTKTRDPSVDRGRSNIQTNK